MNRVWVLARRYGLDALIVVAVIECTLEVTVRRDASTAPRSTLWFAVPAMALLLAPLLARRRFPFGAPVALWILGAAVSFVDGRLIVFTTAAVLGGLAAAFLLGNLRSRAQARIGLAVVLGAAAVIVYNDPKHAPSDLVLTPAMFAVAWLAGFALRERAEQAEAAESRARHAEQEREAAARIAVAEERARIARELHDIVAHAVSVMVLQVGAVRHRLPQSADEDRDALNDVERAGRAALTEMRRLLGAMRNEGEDVELTPQPGLDGLDALVEEVGRAGLPVRLHLVGEPVPLPRALDLSAYRIIQEGLTNTLKHSQASHADVTVQFASDELRIEIHDDGHVAASINGRGHGLVGVRERVNIYGGEMSSGRSADGGFVLTTRLPISGDPP